LPSKPLCLPVAIGPAREGKVSAPLADLPVTIERLLAEIQQALHDKALAFRKANTQDAKTYEDLKKAVETGFAFSYWCGGAECEAKIKEETRATMRCIPLERSGGPGVCVYCGKAAQSAPYLPALIDTLRFPRPFKTVLPYCSPGTHRDARARHPG